jgi:hypothetical protein
MREIRIIAGIAIALILFVAGAFVWSLVTAKTGPMDAQAVRRIERQCGFQSECKVHLGDLFDGDWDTFYEFGVGVEQPTIDSVLGTHQVRRADGQRTLVLMKGGHVLTSEHEAYGTEQPLAGQIEFANEHHREQGWVKYGRDSLLRVSTFRTDASKGKGTYYVLAAEEQ